MLRDSNAEEKNDRTALDRLWKWPFQDLQGGTQYISAWRGRVLVVNFWATWCEPCREETPMLVKTHAKYAAKNLQVVGISLDSVVKVQEFAKEFKIQYPLLISGLDAIDITRLLGNKAAGLPYTVVLNAKGNIEGRHLGGITEARLEQIITPLLAPAGKSS
ncbi:MAG: TlpA family protein disulfide reductase [Burkholderiales bacterium]